MAKPSLAPSPDSSHPTLPVEVALAFTRAWAGHDLAAAAAFVDDAVVFDGPLQQSVGAEPYMHGLRMLSRDVSGLEVIAAFGDAEQALLMYELLTGPYGKLTCAKRLIVRNGKIVHDRLAFDSHRVRAAGDAPPHTAGDAGQSAGAAL